MDLQAGSYSLVTGGARRLGRSIVEGLAATGSDVLIHANHSAEQAHELAQQLQKQERNAAVQIADLSDADALEQFSQDVLGQFGPPKYLVLNAANFVRKSLSNTDCQTWDAVQNLNLRAPILLADRFGRAMHKHGGAVVVIVDAAGLHPWPNYAAHSIAKAGLIPGIQLLASDLAPSVTVNGVAPGPVLFPEHYDQAAQAAAIERTVLKRSGSPGDVVSAVIFFCRHAPYVTGTVLPVDGGRHLLGMPPL